MVDILYKKEVAGTTGQARYRAKRRATLVGAAVNLPMALGKILAGYFGHSQALIADGVHSLSDLVSDALVLIALRVGAKQADIDHPYGHARIETAAVAGVALFLLLAAAGIAYAAVRSIGDPALLAHPGWLALWVAFASLAIKEGLYWYTIGIAKRTGSALLRANAWHHRSDALSSIVTVIAIVGSMLGVRYMDALGALLIAVMLTWIGVKYAWRSFAELVDTGLDPARLEVVREHIASVPGVRHMRRLRTRTMGGSDAYADVGVLVDPYMSLTEAHRVSEAISKSLIAQVEEISDICVHIEPDGHADAPAAFELPLREQIVPRLRQACAGLTGCADIQRITLHYLDDAIEAEVLLPLQYVDEAGQAERIKSAYAQAGESVPGIRALRVLFG